eukprot:4543-Chlamydomonas_euryale.AAC.2
MRHARARRGALCCAAPVRTGGRRTGVLRARRSFPPHCKAPHAAPVRAGARRAGVLRGCRGGGRALDGRPRTHQGLHHDAQAQRLPKHPHDGATAAAAR